MKATDRKDVLKRAWKAVKETGMSLSECMKLSWKAYRLVRDMRKGVVTFMYKKVDGTIREAHGTLTGIPEGLVKGEGNRSVYHVDCYKMVSYYDVDSQGFRSFKLVGLL